MLAECGLANPYMQCVSGPLLFVQAPYPTIPAHRRQTAAPLAISLRATVAFAVRPSERQLRNQNIAPWAQWEGPLQVAYSRAQRLRVAQTWQAPALAFLDIFLDEQPAQQYCALCVSNKLIACNAHVRLLVQM